MRLFWLIFTQTITHAFRKGGGAFGTLAFYLIIITLFSFALGPDGLKAHAGAIMCVSLLLASVTALPLLYERDYEDGSLEQLFLQPVAMEIVALAKIMGQWFAITGPILFLSPLIAIMANLPSDSAFASILNLALASPTIIAIGSIAAALTIGSKRGGLLQALVMLPLATPVLIFAATITGKGSVLFLSGLLLASVPLSCIVSAVLIRINQD
ncbi:MAG: heme exporter protein CcmB [Rickettsiales bacterium]|nr:heme exporter protein CcmB [Rickettsiales bacterium]